MKKFFLFALMALSLQGFAAESILEFDQVKEVKCHSEAKSLGCLNSSGEENSDCVESNKAKLTAECKEMHTQKRNNK